MAQSNTTTATQRKLEAKALAASSKSEGMRLLYEAGYTVSKVAKVLNVGYAFAYGVAKRAGLQLTAANRRPVKAPITKAKVLKVISKPTEARQARIKAAAAKAAKVAKAAAKTVTKPAKAKVTSQPAAVGRVAQASRPVATVTKVAAARS